MTLTQLGKEIHKTGTAIWHLEKSMDGIEPYVWRFKRVNRPKELFRLKTKKERLIDERAYIKLTTPKESWYPKKQFCGRYDNRLENAKTMIMREAFQSGYNVKSIAGYFKISLFAVYRRIKVKTLA